GAVRKKLGLTLFSESSMASGCTASSARNLERARQAARPRDRRSIPESRFRQARSGSKSFLSLELANSIMSKPTESEIIAEVEKLQSLGKDDLWVRWSKIFGNTASRAD